MIQLLCATIFVFWRPCHQWFCLYFFSEKRSSDLKKISYCQSIFRTLDHIDYEINLTGLNTSTAEGKPLSRVCPVLLTNDQAYKNAHWKSLFIKDAYRFNVIDVSLLPEDLFCLLKVGHYIHEWTQIVAFLFG